MFAKFRALALLAYPFTVTQLAFTSEDGSVEPFTPSEGFYFRTSIIQHQSNSFWKNDQNQEQNCVFFWRPSKFILGPEEYNYGHSRKFMNLKNQFLLVAETFVNSNAWRKNPSGFNLVDQISLKQKYYVLLTGYDTTYLVMSVDPYILQKRPPRILILTSSIFFSTVQLRIESSSQKLTVCTDRFVEDVHETC